MNTIDYLKLRSRWEKDRYKMLEELKEYAKILRSIGEKKNKQTKENTKKL